MRKKILTLVLAAVIAAVAIAGASVAYFTDTKTAQNAFTMGNVKITLDEAPVDENGRAIDGDRVIGNEYGIDAVYPGAVLDKDPTVHNTGKNAAYIRAVVTVENGMNWLGLYNENVWTAPQEPAFIALINDTLGEGWELVDIAYDMSGPDHPTSDFVATLKYTEPLAAGADTTAMFSQIAFPAKMTENDVTTRIAQDGSFSIDVVAQAVQTNGFATWEDAFAAFDGN